MMRLLGRYLLASVGSVVESWNEFWFSPTKMRASGIVRFFFGLWVVVYAISWIAELPRIIGPTGLMDAELTRYLIGHDVDGTGSQGRLSLLYLIDSPRLVQGYLLATVVLGLAMAMGLGGRSVVLATSVMALGIAHRIPMLQGPGELLVVGMLCYLVIDPGKVTRQWKIGLDDDTSRSTAGLATRLLQVHFGLWMLVALLSNLGESMWWDGTALWSLAAAERTTGWTRDYLVDHPLMVNFLSHAYLVIHALMLILLFRRGCRVWGVATGLALSLLSYAMNGDLLYAFSVMIALSPFFEAARSEVIDSNKEQLDQVDTFAKLDIDAQRVGKAGDERKQSKKSKSRNAAANVLRR